MKFGLNKVTGTGRQTVEQLKHKVIDEGGGGSGGGGGSVEWEEVLVSDLTLSTDDYDLIWYKIPNDKEFLVEGTNGGETANFLICFELVPGYDMPTTGISGGGLNSGDTLGTPLFRSIPFVNLKKIEAFSFGENENGGIIQSACWGSFSASGPMWIAYYDDTGEEFVNKTTIKFYKVKGE